MWSKAADWVLGHFIGPPAFGRPAAMVIVIGLVLAIGVADALAGINISFAVFYFIPLALALAWLGWKDAAAVAVGSVVVRLVGDYAAIDFARIPLWTVWNSLSALAIFLLMTWVLNELLGLMRQLEKRVEERTAELLEAARARRQLELELLAVGSRERNAIGQELHDDICQHLVGTAMAAQVLARELGGRDPALAKDAQAIVRWVEEGADKTRKLARGLLLAEIAPARLAERFAELCEEADGIEPDGGTRAAGGRAVCVFHKVGEPLVASAGTAAQLFRIGQEALRNALRHAEAGRVAVTLAADEQGITLTVEDDGKGVVAPREGGMGLKVMSHRALFIGGEFAIDAVPGRGTRVICRLPRGI